MPKDSRIVKAAGILGQAVGAFEQARLERRSVKRPPFFRGMTDEGRWRRGDLDATTYQAQKRAIQCSWVFTAIRFIASEVSAAKFEVLEYKGYESKPESIDNHPLEELLRHPNPWMGGAFLWQYSTWWLQLNGNFYWYIGWDGEEVQEIWPLPSQDVVPVPGDDGQEFISHYEYTAGGRQYNIPAEYVVHVKLPNPFDLFLGMSPLTAAILPVDTDMAQSRWNASFFGRDNVMPNAVINLGTGNDESPIDPGDVQALKDDLGSEYQAHKRKTAVVSVTDLQVELLGWNPRELDFVEGRRFTKEEIYEIYGVPPAMLARDATFSNSGNAGIVFSNKTLYPLLVLVSEQLTTELVRPFYSSELIAGFEDVRKTNREQELNEVNAAGPYLTIDEVRADYWKKPPLPDGRGELTVSEAQSGGMGGGMGGGFETYEGEFEEEGREPERLAPPKGNGLEERPGEGPGSEQNDLLQQVAESDAKKWRTKAIRAIKAGRPLPVDFDSSALPPYAIEYVSDYMAYLNSVRETAAKSDLAVEVRDLFGEVIGSPYPFGSKHQREEWLGRGTGGKGSYSTGRTLR